MAITVLVDVNLDGHGRLIEGRLQTEEWREFQKYLPITFLFFRDVDMDRETRDDVVWSLCQERGYFLLTANRNEVSEDSLGTTIRLKGNSESLPVLTLADADKMNRSTDYLDRVIRKMVEYFWDRDNYLGTGRLFPP